MNGKGRKLFRSAVGILTSVMMMGAYTTTAMASGIGVIDAKDMLDIHAEANTASAVIGQVMEDGHVAILAKYNDWVQIQAGEIAGWVPAENLVETEISNEEAVAANEQVIAERTGATASEDEFFAEEEVQQDETAALQAEASEAARFRSECRICASAFLSAAPRSPRPHPPASTAPRHTGSTSRWRSSCRYGSAGASAYRYLPCRQTTPCPRR